MLQAKPGCYLRLGQGGGQGGCFLHNSRYDFNDEVIPLGAAFSRSAGRAQNAACRTSSIHRKTDERATRIACIRLLAPGCGCRSRRQRICLGAASAQAQTFKFANQGDALSMDPHSLNESLQLSIHRQHLRAAGRARQEARDSCRCWPPSGSRPRRRSGASSCARACKFHDGTPFTADDVVFSFDRAQRRRLRHEDLRRPDQGGAQGRRSRGRHRDHGAVPDPAGRDHAAGTS